MKSAWMRLSGSNGREHDFDNRIDEEHCEPDNLGHSCTFFDVNHAEDLRDIEYEAAAPVRVCLVRNKREEQHEEDEAPGAQQQEHHHAETNELWKQRAVDPSRRIMWIDIVILQINQHEHLPRTTHTHTHTHTQKTQTHSRQHDDDRFHSHHQTTIQHTQHHR